MYTRACKLSLKIMSVRFFSAHHIHPKQKKTKKENRKKEKEEKREKKKGKRKKNNSLKEMKILYKSSPSFLHYRLLSLIGAFYGLTYGEWAIRLSALDLVNRHFQINTPTPALFQSIVLNYTRRLP